MIFWKKYSLLILLLSTAALTISTCSVEISSDNTSLIPRKIIFGNPVKTSPQLSPDGNHLAYLAPDEGTMNVWMKTVGKEDDRVLTKDRHRGIMGYFWAPNGDQILYIQDKDGDENWRIYSISITGGDPTNLTPLDGVRAQIVAVDPEFPDEILIGLNNRIPQLHDIYRLNLKSGEMQLEVQNNLGAMGWLADHNFRVRIAMLPKPDGGTALMHRKNADDAWELLTDWGYEDALSTGAFGFSKDNNTLYMISSVGSNTAELRELDIATGKAKTIASDPDFDVNGLMMQRKTYELEAVRFGKDRSDWQAIDPEVQPHLDALKKLNHGDFAVVNRTYDDGKWLVVYDVDNGPVVYYVYDVSAMNGELLFNTRPELENVELAKMEPVTITARDGMKVYCYLTMPLGKKQRNLPAVMMIHGGPWYRDSWGYNSQVQWLANRGYAVMQVNFRGSTGYGKKYVNAGNKEWGGKMQDDVTDATKYLIDQGIADPEKIAIYGGSYGGFAVLSGVTKEPDLYSCGLDFFGPSNLLTWINTIPPYWEPLKPTFYKRIGHPEVDSLMLMERSPIHKVDDIIAPMLIVQGANDPRVPRAESLQIRDALQKAGKEVMYLEFEDEGHGFAKEKNRLKFFAVAEKFLAEHIGGRYEPDPDETK